MEEFAPIGTPPYRVWNIDSIFELEAPEWLLDYVIPKGGSVLVYGPTNVGKSLVTLDWAFRLASGWGWLGQHAQQCSVLYIYAEGGHDLQLRYQAWVEGHKHNQPGLLFDNLHFIGLDEEIKLRWNPDAEEPPEGVRRLYETVNPEREGQRKYDVIIFDPAQEVWRGMNGNSDQEVAMAWRIVKDIQRMHDAASVIVHHARKEGDTFRGATTWLDLADTGFAVTSEGNGLVEVTNSKNRYAEKGKKFVLQQKPHQIDKVDKLRGMQSVFLDRGYRRLDDNSPDERNVLAVIAGREVTIADLTREADVPRTTLARILDKLVARGLIERREDNKRYRMMEDTAEEPEEL